MIRRRHLAAAVAAVAALSLAGCAGTPDPTTTTTAVEMTSAPAETAPTPTPSTTSEAPVSDIEAAVSTFVAALDQLGIEHSEPVRTEVGGSGAKAVFDITVAGSQSGINVFPDAETLATWQELSDAYGGIHVALENAALSLNSSDGIAKSAEIAPLIADAVGGEARGV